MKEKILIIEDDPLIRNELKTLLQSNGYETVAPEDFFDVIDQIKAELKKQWEELNGRPWPKYKEDVYSASGKLIRKAGSG